MWCAEWHQSPLFSGYIDPLTDANVVLLLCVRVCQWQLGRFWKPQFGRHCFVITHIGEPFIHTHTGVPFTHTGRCVIHLQRQVCVVHLHRQVCHYSPIQVGVCHSLTSDILLCWNLLFFDTVRLASSGLYKSQIQQSAKICCTEQWTQSNSNPQWTEHTELDRRLSVCHSPVISHWQPAGNVCDKLQF